MLSLVILFVTGVLVMFTTFSKNHSLHKILSVLGVLASIGALFCDYDFSSVYSSFYSSNTMNLILTLLTLVVLLFIFLNERNENNAKQATINSMILFSSCGAVLLFGANNLLSIFLGIEILSIPLYVLASSNRNNRLSLEAGLKYFILGAFASAILVFGIALVYGSYGTFQLDTIRAIKTIDELVISSYYYVGMIMILAAMCFKMALAPFHFWSPDVYEGSPTLITTYMATVVKLSATMAMFIVLNGFFGSENAVWLKLVYVIAAISLVLSSTMGLVQHNVKRIMAYSSISHAAFILLAIAMHYETQNSFYLLIYAIVYVISSLLVFLILNNEESKNELHLDSLNGLAKKDKVLSIGLLIGILSMAGIPLTGGFVAKYNVLINIFSGSKVIFGLCLLASIVAIGYYLKIINRAFFFDPVKNQKRQSSNNVLKFSVAILSCFTILLGLFPNYIVKFLENLLS